MLTGNNPQDDAASASLISSQERGASPWLRLAGWCLSSFSIASLLLYFSGLLELRTGVFVLLPLATAGLAGLWLLSSRRGHLDFAERLRAGLWAGAIATFTYDVVRVPIAMSGTPLFKAISYFGTVILDQRTPTFSSELVGWSYHLSNGVGFGLMYALMVRRPKWWTAVAWGVALECVMLLTPYAEVFGYRMSRQFVAISLGAHVVYGLGLWLALCGWWHRSAAESRASLSKTWGATGFAISCLGIAFIALDFHSRHAKSIPTSPPAYIGSHLYTTWDVLEPDRVAALWVHSRFVDREARYNFIPPFSRIQHGKPFDVPESLIRRSGLRSATEVLLEQNRIEIDVRLQLLARMTHGFEITPWTLSSDPSAFELGTRLTSAAADCKSPNVKPCVDAIFVILDEWYRGIRPIGVTNSLRPL